MLENDKIKMLVMGIAVAILVAVPLIYLMNNSTDDPGAELVTVSGEDMKLEDLEAMDTVSGTSSYQNRFNNWNEEADYEGVPLNELVPDMEEGDVLQVTASDGYSQKFSYHQVNPTGERASLQGDIILAYSYNGQKVPEWEDGPMIAVIPDDGEFSNDDLNMTKSITSDFNRQSSAGSLWVKNVAKIEVLEDVYTDTETTLTVEGTTTHDYTMEQIQKMDAYTGEGMFINRHDNVVGPNTYKGVNITKLIYNVYSGEDYTLEVEATDGYKMTYTSDQVRGSFDIYDEDGNLSEEKSDVTMLLAYEEVGEDDFNGGPLRIVIVSQDTQITEGHYWASMVRYIRVKPLGE